MDTGVISWISLAMAVVLALERILKRVKHCESACCKVDMEASSPKELSIETQKI